MKPNQIKKKIANKLKDLRKERRLTQKEIANLLKLSQSRYSEIENGKGSFTAEQLIIIMQYFNKPLSFFVGDLFKNDFDGELQNTLARLGESNLKENTDLLPSEKINEVNTIIKEILISAPSSRHIISLAPIIVKHAKNIKQLSKFELNELCGRFYWLIDSVLAAINIEINQTKSISRLKFYRKASFYLNTKLIYRFNLLPPILILEDILDNNITSKKTLEEIKKTRSDIARKWKIITRIKTEDFVNALRDCKL